MDEYIQMLDKRRLHYLGPDMLEKTSFFDLYLSARRLKHCNNGAYEDTCMMRRMLGRDGIHISLTSNS